MNFKKFIVYFASLFEAVRGVRGRKPTNTVNSTLRNLGTPAALHVSCRGSGREGVDVVGVLRAVSVEWFSSESSESLGRSVLQAYCAVVCQREAGRKNPWDELVVLIGDVIKVTSSARQHHADGRDERMNGAARLT